MVAKKQNSTTRVDDYEEKENSGKIGRILASVALYGLMLLLGYIVCATPETGTAMGSIRDVLFGLGGSIAICIPLMIGWIATLVMRAAVGKKISPLRCICDGLLFLCLFTALQLFVTDYLIRNIMNVHSFFNYVRQSFSFGSGGGALGSLLAYPLYTYFGKWGGLLGTLLIALLSLTATGRTQKFVQWVGQQSNKVSHDRDQKKKIKENERLFESDETPRDPQNDNLYFDRVGRSEHPKDNFNGKKHKDITLHPEDWPIHKGEKLPHHDREPLAFEEPSHPSGRRRPRRRPMPENGGNVQRAGERPARPNERPNERPASPNERPIRPNERPIQPDEHLNERTNERPVKPDERPVQEHSGEQKPVQSEERPAETVKGSDHQGVPFQDQRPLSERMAHDDAPKIDVFEPASKKAPAEAAEEAPVRPQSMEADLTIEPETCDVLEGDAAPFDIPAEKPEKKKIAKIPRPAPVAEEEDPYNYPPIDLLEMSRSVQENHEESDMRKAALLEETLKQFGISTKLTGIAHGPAVTRFELKPAAGIKLSRITALADDIAMRLAAMSVRIEAPIPGKDAVGVEIPNEKVEMVRLRDVLESPEACKSKSKLSVGLGKDNSGRYIVADVAKMPHVLIAGQTGSGKSVCINSIITSILYRATPDEVRLILIDPKMVELSIYNDIPHLVCPVVTDCKKAASALDWAVAEMSMRYKRFAERGVRDIKGYNKTLHDDEKIMPQMVIIIDELADLMMVAPGEVEDSIMRLAQLARAAGIHLVIATQRPSVNVVTGTIKANIPSRIAFSVASQVDSRTMIDHGGAEKLLGNGDMLFVPSGINKPMRVQGAWVSDEEVHAVTEYIKERSSTSYDENMIEQMENATKTDAEKEEFNAEYDPRLPEAVEIVVEAGQASVSMLQRRMRVGYARAGRLIDEMEQRGIVSEADGAKPRSVLISRDEVNDLFIDVDE